MLLRHSYSSLPNGSNTQDPGPEEAFSIESDAGELDWCPEEERKVVRKLDCTVMPLLILVFIGLQLDRGHMCKYAPASQ